MTGIFVPIYLLRLGYGLERVLLYFVVYSISVFLFTYLAGLLSGRIGLKRTMMLYFPLLLAFLAMVMLLKYVAFPLWLIAIFSGSNIAFYWYPLNVFFVCCSSQEKMGEGYGKLSAYPKATGWIAPLLGGWIASAFSQGFLVIFALSGLIFLVSLIPIFTMEDIFPEIRLQIKPFVEFFTRYQKYIFIETLHYFQVFSEQTIWPIFVFITFNSIFSIGVMGTALAAGSYFMMLFTGVGSDKGKRKSLLLWGACVMSIIWILRAVTHDQMFFYALF
jgi:MFS family permease